MHDGDFPTINTQTLAQRLYPTPPYPCSYLSGQTAQSLVILANFADEQLYYNYLITLGFRRNGTFIYKPNCLDCHACVSMRVPVLDFRPSRSQNRTSRRYQGKFDISFKPLTFEQSHYDLYLNYQRTRHRGLGMDVDNKKQYKQFLLESQVDSFLVEFKDADTRELKIVCLVDKIGHGLSAVYTFYDPTPLHSYGTYAILWQIEFTRSLGLEYLYLGYWVENSSKMRYKAQFLPHERLDQSSFDSTVQSTLNPHLSPKTIWLRYEKP